jgi:hypothetical protein
MVNFMEITADILSAWVNALATLPVRQPADG